MGFAFLSPVLILYKLKLIPNWKAKEVVLRYFFRGESLIHFNEKGRQFALECIPAMLRQEALDKLQKHLQEGAQVIVITASASNWVKAWTDQLGVELIATELEVKDENITGNIDGKNCYGPEKVARLCRYLRPDDYDEIAAYGDSRGDKELLELATAPFYRQF